MAKWSKKIRAVVDPIGSAAWRYAGKHSKHIKRADDILHSWGYAKKHILGLKSSNSASGYYGNSIYGVNGSIVGRY